MNSREIILANIAHTNPPRCGMTFDGGRIDDFEWCGLTAHGFQQRRWTDGLREYYDDEWGNLWVRMVDGSVKGEILPAGHSGVAPTRRPAAAGLQPPRLRGRNG